MIAKIRKVHEIPQTGAVVYLINKVEQLANLNLTESETAFMLKEFENKINPVEFFHTNRKIFVYKEEETAKENETEEKARKAGFGVFNILSKHKYESVTVCATNEMANLALAFAVGLALSNYKFVKYFTKPESLPCVLNEILIACPALSEALIVEQNILVETITQVRNWVNEPVMYLTATKFAHEMHDWCKKAGITVEIFDKLKIEALKMGGLLAVNAGSPEPPSFTIMEWKPENAVNQKPIVLVGKGVVYDTGGLSLKPTPGSMDIMKCDMAGGATVAGIIYSVAQNKLPVHVIALVPATDNRPGGNAYTPGDVITMFDKQTVEVLNTDAEGRMLLADALSFAKKYNPELVIDMATLTGAAMAAIGYGASVVMGTADEDLKLLSKTGLQTYERTVEFPIWNEYDEMIKSDIADMKNVGGKFGGAITAGKFLQRFTDYPWIHIDIAGPAWADSTMSWWGKGGTGYGVRLIYSFIKNKYNL